MSRKYQVQTGDVLTKIAQRFYGEATLSPLFLGELDVLSRPVNPLAFFPWVQSFDGGDVKDGDQRWFAFNSVTSLYVAGPVDHLTFSAGFSGQVPDQSGFAEVYVCVNGYLEAAPAS
jgi:hypothetical protein